MIPEVAQLKDIRGLDTIPWWPPAIGWWLCAALAISLFLLFAWWRQQRLRYPLGSWQKDAQRRLRRLRRRLPEWGPKRSASELSELLRRIAMARHGRESCAGLVGNDWLEWVQNKDPSGFQWLTEGRALLELPYAPPEETGRSESLERLIEASLHWVFAKQEPDHV